MIAVVRHGARFAKLLQDTSESEEKEPKINTMQLLIRKEIGKRIKNLRRHNGWTQKQLAQRYGSSMQMVQKYEKGEHGIRFDQVHLMAKALGVTPEHLYFGHGSYSEELNEIISIYQSLSSIDQRHIVLSFVRSFKQTD